MFGFKIHRKLSYLWNNFTALSSHKEELKFWAKPKKEVSVRIFPIPTRAFTSTREY